MQLSQKALPEECYWERNEVPEVSDQEAEHVEVHEEFVPGLLPGHQSHRELPQFKAEIKTVI